VTIGKDVFIGPGVIFTNIKYPSSKSELPTSHTLVENHVGIGAGVIILPDVKIGEGALIGAGSVVTKDVLPYTVVYGNPAKIKKKITQV
jgi:UDP-2-acetamido-3-amino-2,3-dideoxy-glucuronate N-acetyltransferase